MLRLSPLQYPFKPGIHGWFCCLLHSKVSLQDKNTVKDEQVNKEEHVTAKKPRSVLVKSCLRTEATVTENMFNWVTRVSKASV